MEEETQHLINKRASDTFRVCVCRRGAMEFMNTTAGHTHL